MQDQADELTDLGVAAMGGLGLPSRPPMLC